MMTACASCGTANPAGSRFCNGCGALLSAAGAAHEERKVVTVLFADLVGFTARAEPLDPEDVRAFLLPYYDVLTDEIDAHGGRVDRFLGDGIMALFGAPTAHEDDPERAVRAALRILERMPGLGLDLHVRIGVNTGPVLFAEGTGGRDDSVTGDAVNTAARLQAAAPVDGIVVGEPTYRATSHLFRFEALEPVSAKGKAEPVSLWRAVASAAGAGGMRLTEAAPFVGRDQELASLVRSFERSRSTPSVELVTILADPGIGKSRIVRELERHVRGIAPSVLWHEAGPPPYGAGLAFWALAEMIRQRARISDAEGPAAARRRLGSCLARYAHDDDERRWVTPHVESLLGLGPTPAGDREEAFTAWRTFFERVADRGPTVLVFDDLHRADGGLLDFIDELAGETDRPILLVAIARPELRDQRPHWGAAWRSHEVIELSRLSRESMGDLLAALAADLPPALADRILDRADGIPLYAVEILRMLADRGDLEPAGGTYRVRRVPDRVSVPASLQALVAARLDALDVDERAIVRDAAVLGDAFRAGALAAVAGRTSAEIAPVLDRLVRHELLASDGDDGPSADRLRFSHALVREVAYGTLTRRDRRTLHLAAADHYAELEDPELGGEVAPHLLAAYRAAPTGPGDPMLAVRVVAALRTAAERAAAVHAPETALAFLNDALSVAVEQTDQAGLHQRAATAAQQSARLEEAESHALVALDLFRLAADPPEVARTAARLGSIQVERYDAGAVATLQTAVDELAIDAPGEDPTLADEPAAVELLAQLARAHVVNGHTAEALAYADRALRRADRLHLVQLTADGLAAKGAALLEACRVPEGVALVRASLDVADEHGLVAAALRARSSLSSGLIFDDPGEAFRIARDGLEIARDFGFRDLAVRIASNWGQAAVETGAWDLLEEVLTALQRPEMALTDRVDLQGRVEMIGALRGGPGAASRFDALAALVSPAGEQLAEASHRARRGWALLASGRPRAALEDADAARALLRAVGPRTVILDGTILAAHAALWTGDVERLERAVDEMSSCGLHGRWFDGVTASLTAGLAARRGSVSAAIRGYRRAEASWRGLETPFAAALSSLEASALLPASGAAASAATDTARRRLADLRATALLDRLATGLVADG